MEVYRTFLVIIALFVAEIGLTNAGDTFLGFSPTEYEPTEGDGAVDVTVVRSGDETTSVTVSLVTIPLTATTGVDYIHFGNIIIFLPGETTKTVTVSVIDDNESEGTEVFQMEIDFISEGTILNKATVRLIDNDGLSLISFRPTTYTVNEDDGSVSVILERIGNLALEVVVELTTSDTTANGTDYHDVMTNVTFVAGQNGAVILIEIIDNDNSTETDETFEITAALVSPGSGAALLYSTATITIVEDVLSTQATSTADTTTQSSSDILAIGIGIFLALILIIIVIVGVMVIKNYTKTQR